MLQIYNSLTRQKERFKPLRQEETKVYYCGPTPYNFAHIGNLRNYLYEDFVVRTMRFLGYPVRTVMNVTDIDDKTIRDSQKLGVPLLEHTKKFTDCFLEDIAKLHIHKADSIVPISTLIPTMNRMIQGLLDKGFAYLADDGSVYYSISKFKKYGALANLDFSGMKQSVRINNDEYDKENASDFALWKAYDEASDGPNKWEATFVIGGENVKVPGRPGWHIECSACNLEYFGEQIDLHMGGIDNLFPHHENEIAQSEAFTGKKFSTFWAHGGHLLVDNQKMAKSKNNFYTLRDLEEKLANYPKEKVYRGFRLMALQTHYRESFNFTFDRVDAAIRTVEWYDEAFKRLSRYSWEERKVSREVRDNLQWIIQAFVEALEDDFGTPEAMAVVSEFITWTNAGIDNKLFCVSEKQAIIGLFKTLDSVLSIFDFSLLESASSGASTELLAKLDARNAAKLAKNYSLADSLRDEIMAEGYKIVDTKEGSFLEKV